MLEKGFRIVDLSVPIEDSPSEPFRVEVTHQDHDQGAAAMLDYFGCSTEDLPKGKGWANDSVTLIAHSGTHLDAPWHFAPESEGKPARTIDQVPLEWCYGPGVVLDFRHLENGALITKDHIEEALKKIDYTIKPFDIVLIMTGADKYWGKEEYFHRGVGMGRESTLLLCKKGVKIMGTDAWGFDRPFKYIAEEFQRDRDPKIIWEAHFAGIECEYCHLEKLANLDQLPPYGFTVACFPVKITGGSAGWSRPVAFVPQD
jgi:kynurenine formamidase